VLIAELSGSDSVLHFDLGGRTWVSQSQGIHPFEVGRMAKLSVDVEQGFFFDRDGRLIAGGAYG
jgi:glycerol transport system ATP-binding protein